MKSPVTIPKTDKLKKLIDAHRPLSRSELLELQKWYRVSMTYHSNAIEGSTLTEGETKLIIEDGLTIGGKTIREINEAINHGDLVNHLYDVVKKRTPITEKLISKWHSTLLSGIDEENAGKYRKVKISVTGTQESFPSSSEVPDLMKNFYRWLNGQTKAHPILIAAEAHWKFVKIHPFIDGNGRTARLLMNIILMQAGYPPTIIPLIRRADYMLSLKKTLNQFTDFIAETVYENTKDYCRMLEIKF